MRITTYFADTDFTFKNTALVKIWFYDFWS